MNYHKYISIKSKIGVEYRRYSLRHKDVNNFDGFYDKIKLMHHLENIPFVIFYTDSKDFPLPINNSENLAKAISSAKFTSGHDRRFGENNNIQQRPYLRLFLVKKKDFLNYYNGDLSGLLYKKGQNFKLLTDLMLSSNDQNLRPSIGVPEDFRQVSSIIDVDTVPKTCRRVCIKKKSSDKPLGFYIREGTYERLNSYGRIETVKSVFISRVVPGGLAESTGLLAVNDEVLEVNGIQVRHDKTLEQVTDMMIANCSNLIITIRPWRVS